MAEQKSPPSEMIRVPTALIPVVRELSKLNREGHTIALLQALEELIANFDSSIDIDVVGYSKPMKHLSEKLSQLESHLVTSGSCVSTKLEALASKLEQLELAISSNKYNIQARPRRQPYPYQQPQVELQPRTNESLATRLAVTTQSLITEREKLTTKEFISWSRNRDPMTVGWQWNAKDGLYHPVLQ